MAGSSPLSAIAWEVNGSLDAASQTPLPTGERALRDPQESLNLLLLGSMGFLKHQVIGTGLKITCYHSGFQIGLMLVDSLTSCLWSLLVGQTGLAHHQSGFTRW